MSGVYSEPDYDLLIGYLGADFAVAYETDYPISGYEHTAVIYNNKGVEVGEFRVIQDNDLKLILLDFENGKVDISAIGKGEYNTKLMQRDISSGFTIPILIIDFHIKQ